MHEPKFAHLLSSKGISVSERRLSCVNDSLNGVKIHDDYDDRRTDVVGKILNVNDTPLQIVMDLKVQDDPLDPC